MKKLIFTLVILCLNAHMSYACVNQDGSDPNKKLVRTFHELDKDGDLKVFREEYNGEMGDFDYMDKDNSGYVEEKELPFTDSIGMIGGCN
jgi:membrane-bound lytic murein transglycosylase MltF